MLMMPLLGLGAKARVALAADFGMTGPYTSTDAGAAASLTLTVNPDGTWALSVGGGDALGGAPTTGTWAAYTAGGVGDDYELQFAVDTEVNTPNVSNGAASFTHMASSLAITVSRIMANASCNVTVNIRPLGASSTALTDAANFAANGA